MRLKVRVTRATKVRGEYDIAVGVHDVDERDAIALVEAGCAHALDPVAYAAAVERAKHPLVARLRANNRSAWMTSSIH